MDLPNLTAEQAEAAEQLYQAIRVNADAKIRELAVLMASKSATGFPSAGARASGFARTSNGAHRRGPRYCAYTWTASGYLILRGGSGTTQGGISDRWGCVIDSKSGT